MDGFDRLTTGGEVDVRVQGLGVYTVVLAGAEGTTVGERKRA